MTFGSSGFCLVVSFALNCLCILSYELCIHCLLLLWITCRNETHEVIKYLEYCVHRLHNEDPGVHNLLLSLYAKKVDLLTLEF
jgi:hypothetical protein